MGFFFLPLYRKIVPVCIPLTHAKITMVNNYSKRRMKKKKKKNTKKNINKRHVNHKLESLCPADFI